MGSQEKESLKKYHKKDLNFFESCTEGKLSWDWDKNSTIDPYEESPESRRRAWFICEKGHSYRCTIRRFVKLKGCCSVCEAEKKAVYQIPHAVCQIPHMVEFWDYKVNKKLDIENILSTSQKMAWWTCKKCHYHWREAVGRIKKRMENTCPSCEIQTKLKVEKNELFIAVPKVEEYFDYHKNVGVDISTITVKKDNYLGWRCPVCSYRWNGHISSIVIKKNGSYEIKKCSICNEQESKKNYATEYPELVPWYDEKVNRYFDLTDNNRRPKKSEKIWWYCQKCGIKFRETLDNMIHYIKCNSEKCPYCSGRKILNKNSFALAHPEIMDEFCSWDYVDPFSASEHSKYVAYWRCRHNKDHSWNDSFDSRALGFGNCPKCIGKKAVATVRTLFDSRPELVPEWSENNTSTMSELLCNSSKSVLWVCPKCCGEYSARISDREKGDDTCPYCSDRKLLPGYNSIEDKMPELIPEWSKKNRTKPNKHTCSSIRDVIWECSKCKGEYKYPIIWKIKYGDTCPYCSNEAILVGYNTIADKKPWLVKEWSEKNEKGPKEYIYCTETKVIWNCSTCHGEYTARIIDREEWETSCPYCSNKEPLVGYNTVTDKKPWLVNEWNEKNEKGPTEYVYRSGKMVTWTCSTCSGEYRARIIDRKEGDNRCPYCTNKEPLVGYNTITDKKPWLVNEWNEKNEKGPTEYVYRSGKMVTWTCSTCSGEYRARIIDRKEGDNRCPYCTNKEPLVGYNTIADKKPELISEWSEKNGIRPTECVYSPLKKIVWKCSSCKGEYTTRIIDREKEDQSCPYCIDKILEPQINSFAKRQPELLKEWDYLNNYLLAQPKQEFEHSMKKVWWICQNNPSHKYIMSLRKRVSYQKRSFEPCLYCNGRRRKKSHFFI
jgi:DNA-directed RNA polymerase subunit RPC12/RpoP